MGESRRRTICLSAAFVAIYGRAQTFTVRRLGLLVPLSIRAGNAGPLIFGWLDPLATARAWGSLVGRPMRAVAVLLSQPSPAKTRPAKPFYNGSAFANRFPDQF